jgi:SSS family solute:Na+ symporter
LILIFGMIIFAPMIVACAGGFEHINIVLAAIDPNLVMPAFPGRYATYAYITPEIIFSFGILLIVGLACAPHVVSNVLAVKEVRFFRWAPLIAFATYLTISMLVRFSGMGVRTLVEEGKIALPDVVNAVDYSFVYGISASVGGVVAMGLFAVMILAAVMSTTDRLMLTIGTQFSWNIFKMILRPKATEMQIIRVSRITMLVAVIISLLLAVNPPEILVFLIFLAIGLILASFAIPLIAGMYWRRATTAGAITSMGVGLVTALCFGYYDRFVGQLSMHFSTYALIFSIVTMVIVSLLTKKNSDAALDATYTGWYLHPKE